MEWSIDTKNGYDALEVYMEYGYVFVSSTGRNHAKMVFPRYITIDLSIENCKPPVDDARKSCMLQVHGLWKAKSAYTL